MINKKRLLFSLLIASSSLLIVSCYYQPAEGGNYQRFDWDLHGTWTTNDSESRYAGTLIIDYNRITITGYSETQTPTRLQTCRVPTLHFRRQTGDLEEARMNKR